MLDTGDKGPIGDGGSTPLPGPTGPKGGKGNKGIALGVKGDKGNKGTTGTKGDKGQKGPNPCYNVGDLDFYDDIINHSYDSHPNQRIRLEMFYNDSPCVLKY